MGTGTHDMRRARLVGVDALGLSRCHCYGQYIGEWMVRDTIFFGALSSD